MAQSRIIGLDVGDARIGVAISDPLGMFAQPFDTFERDKQIFGNISQLVESQQVELIVVGLPYELDGSIGPQAEKVKKFAAQLQNSLNRQISEKSIEVIFWDERLTSVQAESSVIGSKLKNEQRSAMVDKVAASIILQSYMDGCSRSS